MDDLHDTYDTRKLVERIVATYDESSGINFIDAANMPVRDRIIEALDLLVEVIFPGYTGKRTVTHENLDYVIGDLICQVRGILLEQVELAFRYKCKMTKCEKCDCCQLAADTVECFLDKLPGIREMLKDDVAAAFDGDPSANSFEEVVISYPYIHAITIHRIAHELYLKKVPLIPRIMSESAHSRTGIDINPGARIGNRFFIDHGTGVVIGETAVIGDNVKLYQGVTLGALSFPKDERGRIVKGAKRHPTIEDNVTIYAEATILGDIVIGKGAVIGGNVWFKESVDPGVTVTIEGLEDHYKHRAKK
ncbi:MAG: serine O-acetyltransferase [Phycisphaerae bacterium]|nr:serine O-acetyltransferase [Phycisphaerae bacterium]